LLFAVIASLLVGCTTRRCSLGRVIGIGFLLGVAPLTLASSQIFLPIAASTIVLSQGWKNPRSWAAGGLLVLAAAIVIAPWTIRNWTVFGEFVPVRTGMGLIGHQGSPTLAGTYHPGPHACTDTFGPMWSASGPYDALKRASGDQPKEFEIYRRSFDCVEHNAPAGYENFNEVQRDQVYLEKTKEFIEREPLVFAELAFFKYLVMVRGWAPEHTLTGVLCLLALFVFVRKPAALIIGAMILAYVAPYALGIPWFYRYRFPIEPLIIVLAVGLLVHVLSAFRGSRAAVLFRSRA
jgi:hypothetical protein